MGIPRSFLGISASSAVEGKHMRIFYEKQIFEKRYPYRMNTKKPTYVVHCASCVFFRGGGIYTNWVGIVEVMAVIWKLEYTQDLLDVRYCSLISMDGYPKRWWGMTGMYRKELLPVGA